MSFVGSRLDIVVLIALATVPATWAGDRMIAIHQLVRARYAR